MKVKTNPLRAATLSLGAGAAAVLAVTFLPGGVAAAGPEDELFWALDPNQPITTLSSTTDPLGIQTSIADVSMDACASPSSCSPAALPYDLQAELTNTDISWLNGLGPDFETFDITKGDAAIPDGSVIDLDYLDLPALYATETVEVPGAGLFGLPDITETFFTPLGDFSI
jgi:hypothetical protein